MKILLVSLAFALLASGAPAIAQPARDAAALPADGVVVTYFTTNVRCPSCRKIEKMTKSLVEKQFAPDLAAGRVVVRVVNTDEPENKHFIETYKIVSKTVVVSRRAGGTEAEWKNLQDVWLKFSDAAAFDAYVSGPIRDYALKGVGR